MAPGGRPGRVSLKPVQRLRGSVRLMHPKNGDADHEGGRKLGLGQRWLPPCLGRLRLEPGSAWAVDGARLGRRQHQTSSGVLPNWERLRVHTPC